MNEAKVTQHLDWLEITYPILGQNLNIAYPEHWSKERVETKPTNGYNVACRYKDGRVEQLHTLYPSMGVHVTFPAQTLAQLKEDEKWLIGWLVQSGATVTRLDFALDCYGVPLDFDALWEEVIARRYTCRLRTPPIRTHDSISGDIIYFGRMKSSIMTRIYNKAAEQKVSGVWNRVETMMRHQRANFAAKKFASTDAEVASFITGHVQIKNFKWWEDVMTMKATKTRYDRPTTNSRREWLMKSVAPSLAREMILDDTLYDDFIRRVDACYRESLEKSYRPTNVTIESLDTM